MALLFSYFEIADNISKVGLNCSNYDAKNDVFCKSSEKHILSHRKLPCIIITFELSGSVLGEGPPGEEAKCEDVHDILHNSPFSVINYTGDTGPETKIDQDSSLYPYPLISNYFSRSPLLSESQYSNETFGSPENPRVFRAKGDLEIRASDGYGILLVDGDLEAKGDFLWQGLIIINGNFRFSGGGNKAVYGAVIAMGSAVRMDGGVDIYYDCTSLSKLRGNLSSYKKLWWYQPIS